MVLLSIKNRHATLLILGICVSCLLTAGVAKAGTKPVVTYSDGRITLKADKSPLLPLLESIAKATNIEIFITKDIKLGDISVQIVNEPLETVFKAILREYSYAAVYYKDGDLWRITSLRIYPEGKYSGEAVSISPGSRSSDLYKGTGEAKTVLFRDSEEIMTYGSPASGGLLVPSRSVPKPSEQATAQVNTPWFRLQKQLEREEARQYEKLMHHKRKLEATQDPDKKEALLMAYTKELEKFYAMKKAHLNKIEALRRIQTVRELSQK